MRRLTGSVWPGRLDSAVTAAVDEAALTDYLANHASLFRQPNAPVDRNYR